MQMRYAEMVIDVLTILSFCMNNLHNKIFEKRKGMRIVRIGRDAILISEDHVLKTCFQNMFNHIFLFF